MERIELSKSLADWLVATLGECSLAIPVPQWVRGDVWGTPDIVGVRLAGGTGGKSDETVTVKIAYRAADLPMAFGQTCWFKLCCHRAYLAVPHDFGARETERAAVVCLALRIGLIVFDRPEVNLLVFGLRVRATTEAPDPFSNNPWIEVLSTVRWCNPYGTEVSS